MNARVLISLLGLTVSLAHANPSVFDLVGDWGATAEFGKFKIRLVVKVMKTPDGKLSVKLDIPDQGARDMPVAALLYNAPAVRWEIDQLGTAFNGKLNEAGTEIAGGLDEGPGGKPVPLVYKRIVP